MLQLLSKYVSVVDVADAVRLQQVEIVNINMKASNKM